MLRGSGNEGVGGSVDELLGIPEVEGSVLEGASDDALRVLFCRGTPSNVVKSDRAMSAEVTIDKAL